MNIPYALERDLAEARRAASEIAVSGINRVLPDAHEGLRAMRQKKELDRDATELQRLKDDEKAALSPRRCQENSFVPRPKKEEVTVVIKPQIIIDLGREERGE